MSCLQLLVCYFLHAGTSLSQVCIDVGRFLALPGMCHCRFFFGSTLKLDDLMTRTLFSYIFGSSGSNGYANLHPVCRGVCKFAWCTMQICMGTHTNLQGLLCKFARFF